MTKWLIKKAAPDLRSIAETFRISEIMAQILINRGIRSKKDCMVFLNPEMKYMYAASLLRDVHKAIKILIEAVSRYKKIGIYGDYDVDGVMSTVILYKTLKKYGADVSYYIPQREEEGYGLNINAVRKLREAGCDVLFTCDNGIAALAEIDEAKRLGMKVIVLDHHEPGFLHDKDGVKIDVVPAADAVIDAKQQKCAYPFKQLCAAGMAYKFAEEFYHFNNLPFDEGEEYLALATIATFCDVVDLQEENRILVRNGLEALNKRPIANIGLSKLIEEKGYMHKSIGAFEIGFIIGPCINATGRLESAQQAVRLFLTENPQEAEALAKKLVALNEERKAVTQHVTERTMARLQNQETLDKVLVIYDEEAHESIIGIVAGRVKESLCHPVLMLTRAEGCVKGSARSIEGYNMFEALYQNSDLFLRFGGHAMAAGLSMPAEAIDELRERLNAQCALTDEDFVSIVRVDKEIGLSQITYALAEELKQLEPYGKENKEPLFGTKNIVPEQIRLIDDKNTIIFTFPVEGTSRKIKAVCFGMNERFKEDIHKTCSAYASRKILAGILRDAPFVMDLVYAVETNTYNGNTSVQMRIKDYRIRANER